MYKVLTRVLVAAVVGVSTVMVGASPAAAATSRCTTSQQVGAIRVPVSSAGSYNCWMQRGHSNEGVYMLQLSIRVCYGPYLQQIGFPWRVEADSNFGPITEAALREVQKLEDRTNPYGVDVVSDGIYGNVTARVMVHSTTRDYNCYRI